MPIYEAQNEGGTAEDKFSFVLFNAIAFKDEENFFIFTLIKGEMRMGEFHLKDGRRCIFEEPTESAAAEMIDYVKQVGDETDNLTFNSKEFSLSVEDEARFLKSQHASETSFMLVVRIEGKIVASLGMQSNPRNRLRHRGTFGVSVLKECWGLGIGTLLIEEMIRKAKSIGITKLNLKVRTDNYKAIDLYKRIGFIEEGKESRGMRINGEYVDFILMGLILD